MTRWLPGYKYRKKLTATASGTNATDYQVLWRVYYVAGTDATNQVFLNGKSKVDLSDVRFTLDDGYTTLPFWVEHPEITGNGFNVWVRIPSVATTGTGVYLYYGRDSVATASNGALTFPFFDDFEGSALDTGKWTQRPSTTSTIGSSLNRVRVTASSGEDKGINSIATFGQNYSFRGYGAFQHGTNLYPLVGFSGYSDSKKEVIYSDNTNFRIQSYDGTNNSVANILTKDTNYHIFEVFRNGSTSVIGYVGTSTNSVNTYLTNSNQYVVAGGQIGAEGLTTDITFDWILVRSYVATEPTCTVSGIEERNTLKPILQQGWRL